MSDKYCDNCKHQIGADCVAESGLECVPGKMQLWEAKETDTTKPPLSHILRFPTAINGLAEVLEHGAAKYGGFKAGKADVPILVQLDSLLRHATALANGEETDPDSGKSHRFHLLANALFIADNRPKDRPEED